MKRTNKSLCGSQTISKCLKAEERENPVNIRLSAMVSNPPMVRESDDLTPNGNQVLPASLKGGSSL